MRVSISTVQSFFVGLPIVFLCLAAFTGSFSNALSLLLISVVCTAGIGLVIWVPLCLFAGWIALTVAKQITSTARTSNRDGAARNAAERTEASIRQQAIARTVLQGSTPQERIALDEYIRRAVRLGHTYDRILTTLRQQGWSETEISQAFQATTNP